MNTYNELNKMMRDEKDPAKQQALLEQIQSMESYIEKEFKFEPNNIAWLKAFVKTDPFYVFTDFITYSVLELRDLAYHVASKKMERDRKEEWRAEKDIEFHPEHDTEEENN